MTTETTWFSTERTLCYSLLYPDSYAVPMGVFQDRDERKGERMNRRQFAGVLGISGLSAASYSLVGETSVAEASAEDTLEKAGFLPAAVAEPRVVQYAKSGALPLWVAGTFANQWQRNLDFYQLPQDLIDKYRTAGVAYRNLDDARSIWRTIPEAIRREGPDTLRRFHSGKDWSHIIPRSAGGSADANNGIFEKAALNRARGATPMTPAEISVARQSLDNAALRSAIRQTAQITLLGTSVALAVEATFAVLEHGLQYYDGAITRPELFEKVIKRLVVTGAVAAFVPGIVVGLTFFFPVFIPILGALTIPMAVASFLLMGIRFYRLGREWLDRMGLDPAVYVRDKSRSISDWTRRAAAGAFDEAWDTVQDTSGRVWGATTGTIGRAWDATEGLSEPAWDSVSGTLVGAGDTTQALSGRAWGTTSGVLGRTWGMTQGISHQAWDTTRDLSGQTWDTTRDTSGQAGDAAQDLSGRAWGTTTGALGRAWNATRDAAGRAQQGVTDRLAPESTPNPGD